MNIGTTGQWPTDLCVRDQGRILEIALDDGCTFRLTAERLRVESPGAQVQGHSASERNIVTGKENILIVDIEQIGNYAVKLVFDDGHQTGIYSWDYLSELANPRWTGIQPAAAL